ncbi:MAG: TIGR01212 family radical SAM protein, partial [Deltaproteobacteria bacterium]|nr:TIGR01212 family radical SAM protein [Deltaproteobacteria bacterium]
MPINSDICYYSFNTYLRERYRERVQKITLDAGLTCPNRDGTKGTGGCIYCDNAGSGSNASKSFPSITAQAHNSMAYLTKRYKARKFIAYLQSFCNTYAPLEKLKNMYNEAAALPGVVGLAVATRPDCLTADVLDLLAGYTERVEVWLELGMQTIHNRTLQTINRGHAYEDFLNGFELARHFPLKICLHAIIGLPGETGEDVRATSLEVARLKPEGLKLHSLYVTSGTAIEKLYQSGTYKPLTRDAYVSQACDFLEQVPPATIIQRLTGDPDRNELVAPAWALDKHRTINLI